VDTGIVASALFLWSFLCLCSCNVGLLYAGDKLVEVNGVPVEGLDPEQVIHILVTVLLVLFVSDVVGCRACGTCCHVTVFKSLTSASHLRSQTCLLLKPKELPH